MRLFVALPLPRDLHREMGRLQDSLRPLGPSCGLRFTRPEGIHLTLRFLGETADSRLVEVGAAFAAAVSGTGPLHLRAQGVGFFPDARRPRVLWVGVAGDAERLASLAGRCEGVARGLGFAPEERGFRPHLTLARMDVRSGRGGKDGAAALQEVVRPWENRMLHEWSADTACLYQSILGPGGAVYTVRLQMPLG